MLLWRCQEVLNSLLEDVLYPKRAHFLCYNSIKSESVFIGEKYLRKVFVTTFGLHSTVLSKKACVSVYLICITVGDSAVREEKRTTFED